MPRPTKFTAKTADVICARLVDGQSLRSICAADDMPNIGTVFRWLAARPEFREQYALAREAQADTLFDEMVDIADDGRNDWMVANGEDSDGWRVNGENIQRSKLRVEARKWMAGKLKPKVYGDKVTQEHTGADGAPLTVQIVRFSDDDPAT